VSDAYKPHREPYWRLEPVSDIQPGDRQTVSLDIDSRTVTYHKAVVLEIQDNPRLVLYDFSPCLITWTDPR
jgi:hypothetical protein